MSFVALMVVNKIGMHFGRTPTVSIKYAWMESIFHSNAMYISKFTPNMFILATILTLNFWCVFLSLFALIIPNIILYSFHKYFDFRFGQILFALSKFYQLKLCQSFWIWASFFLKQDSLACDVFEWYDAFKRSHCRPRFT